MAETSPEPDHHTEAYLRLLSQHDRWLTAYVHSLVPLAADADDILQEVKVRMWKHFDGFDPSSNFRAWARTFAMNQVLNYRRASKRHAHQELDEAFIEAVAAELDRQAEVLDLRAERLQQCMQKLPEFSRKVIAWRYDEGCDIGEIAALTQRSMEAVYQLLSRIRRTLADCIEKHQTAQA